MRPNELIQLIEGLLLISLAFAVVFIGMVIFTIIEWLL